MPTLSNGSTIHREDGAFAAEEGKKVENESYGKGMMPRKVRILDSGPRSYRPVGQLKASDLASEPFYWNMGCAAYMYNS